MKAMPKELLTICRWERADGAVLYLYRDASLWLFDGDKDPECQGQRCNPARADQVACKLGFAPRTTV